MAEGEYIKKAVRYAYEVVEGKRPACKWVRLACERQLHDLARDDWGWMFSEYRAEHICRFAQKLPHVQGRWKTANIELEPWQCFMLTTIFGWVEPYKNREEELRNARRFRKALIVLPRKNSKTTIAAIVALFLLGPDREPGAEVYSAAKTRDQAKIAWSIAHRMVQRTHTLQENFGITPMAHSIVCEREGSFYRALSRDADSLEGLNVHGGIIDELHVHPDREVWDVIDNGITARQQPLIFAISTEGDRSEGIFVDQVKYVQEILAGNHEDESYFGIYYGLDPEDDWRLESSWIKANPNWGISVSPREMADKFREAEQLPSAQTTFLTKRLNVRVGAGNAYFNMLAWRSLCADESLRIEDLRGTPCYVTVDLASKSDLTAVMIAFRKSGHYYVFGRYFLPEGALEKGRPNSEFYRSWQIEERLTVTQGPSTDYATVEQAVQDWWALYKPYHVGVDPGYNAEQFRQNMEKAGLRIIEVSHNVMQFSEPMKFLASMLPAGRIHHNGDPVLSWAMGNVTARVDAKDNVYPRKAHPDNKIDPAVSLIANLSLWARQQVKPEPRILVLGA